jgi:hypothetical protein
MSPRIAKSHGSQNGFGTFRWLLRVGRWWPVSRVGLHAGLQEIDDRAGS